MGGHGGPRVLECDDVETTSVHSFDKGGGSFYAARANVYSTRAGQTALTSVPGRSGQGYKLLKFKG